MFVRFLRKKFFVLKFLFIEVIHSIYLILVQYVTVLLLMFYNTRTYKAAHSTENNIMKCSIKINTIKCWIKWFKSVALNVEMASQGKTKGHIAIPKAMS